MKIEGKVTGEVDYKRFYLPGLKITAQCPVCKKDLLFDGDHDYISYPKLGSPSVVYFYCEACDDGPVIQMELVVSKA